MALICLIAIWFGVDILSFGDKNRVFANVLQVLCRFFCPLRRFMHKMRIYAFIFRELGGGTNEISPYGCCAVWGDLSEVQGLPYGWAGSSMRPERAEQQGHIFTFALTGRQPCSNGYPGCRSGLRPFTLPWARDFKAFCLSVIAQTNKIIIHFEHNSRTGRNGGKAKLGN